jgi:hypothetical protein
LFSSLETRRRSADAAWLYALHPLGAVEAAHSGHLEALALLFTMLAIHAWDRGRSGVFWAILGGGTKLLPLGLVPSLALARPRMSLPPLAAGVTIIFALTFPFLGAGATLTRGFLTYAEHWSFNASLFAVLEAIAGPSARLIGVGLGATVCGWAALTRKDPAEVALWCGGTFVLLSPTVHPWYVLWAFVPSLLLGVRSWTLLASLVPLSYWVLVGYHPDAGSWSEPWWPRWILYPPFFLFLSWECVSHWTRPGPWASGRVRTPSS